MNGHGSKRGMDFDPAVRAWMETHTIGDLRNLASKMESKGEEATMVREFVAALGEIESGRLPRMGSN